MRTKLPKSRCFPDLGIPVYHGSPLPWNVIPRHSAYIDPPNHPNVGIYGIHGGSWDIYLCRFAQCRSTVLRATELLSSDFVWNLMSRKKSLWIIQRVSNGGLLEQCRAGPHGQMWEWLGFPLVLLPTNLCGLDNVV